MELQWPDCMPIAVIIVYNPARGCTGCDTTTHEIGSRLTAACELYEALQQSGRYSSVLLMGDFNCRLVSIERHYDPGATPAMGSPSHFPLMARMQLMHISPFHGRGSATPAATTSRPYGGDERPGVGAEVDYICGRIDDVRVQAMPHFPFDAALSPLSHRMLGVVVTMAPAGTVTAPVPARRPWRFRLPPHGDERWREAAEHLLQRLSPPSTEAAAIESLEDEWTAIYDMLEQMLDSTMPRARVGQKRHHPPLPAPVLEAIRRARAQRDHFFSLRGRSDVEPTTLAFAELTLERLRRAARQAHRLFIAEVRQRLIDQLVRLRFVDQHALAELLNRLIPASASIARGADVIPHEPGHAPPLERFRDAFRERAAETRGLAPVFEEASPEMEVLLGFVPVATNNTMLDGRVAWQEVYCVVFPMTHHMVAHMAPCFDDCGVCGAFIDQLRRHVHSHAAPMPDWSPHIHTSVASGPNGIPAEALRWLHHEDLDERFDLRRLLSQRLAHAINRCLDEGRMPDTHQSLESLVTPLLKRGTAAHPCDRADPDDYRTITVGDTLMKVMGLVLLSRLTHWSEANSMLSPAQAGFRVGLATEAHVATLLETVKYHLREHPTVYALFIDLRKAYDTVHLETLWRLLAHMGVPERLVRLLRDWGSRRHARARINNTVTESFPTDKGVPQGDVLSPLLFNLYLEPLLRMIAASDAVGGVPVGEVGSAWHTIIKALGYADDVAVVGTSPAHLQSALDIIMRWCRAWLMDLGVGQGKTEAMMLTYGNMPPPLIPAPLVVGDGRTVGWVQRYRYLGYELCHDLSISPALASMTEKVTGAVGRWFSPHAALRHLPLEVQLMLFTSYVHGIFNYLCGVVPYSVSQLTKLQSRINQGLNHILGVDTSFPRMIVNHETGILSVHALVVHHRLRMQWRADQSPDTCLWKRVSRAAGDRIIGGQASLRQRPWLQVTNEWRGRVETSGHELPATPIHPWQVSAAAQDAARHYATVQWRHAAINGQSHTETQGARDHYREVIGMVEADDEPLTAARTLSDLRGGYAAASLLRLCTLPATSIIVLVVLRMGRKGLFVAPLQPSRVLEVTKAECAARGWLLGSVVMRALPTEYAEPGTDAAVNRILGPALFPCVLCGDVRGESVGHLFARCSHERLVALRAAMIPTIPTLLRDIDTEGNGDPRYAASPARIDAALAAVATVGWASADGTRLLTHLVLAAPLPPAVEGLGTPACDAVRALFDSIRIGERRIARRIADRWVRWSADWAWKFTRARCQAYKTLEPAAGDG